MHITFIARKLNLSGGGSNLSLDLIAQSLVEHGHDVLLLTIKSEMNDLPSDPVYEVVEYSSSFPDMRLTELRDAFCAMKEYQGMTDIFHVFTPAYLGPAGYFRSKSSSTPVVGRLNNYGLFCTNNNLMDGECHRNCDVWNKFAHDPVGRAKKIAKIPLYFSQANLESRYAKYLDRYFALSPAVKRIYSDINIPEEKIIVIPNCYDPNFEAESVSSSPWSSDLFRILYIGRLVKSKGVDTLISAAETLNSVEVRIVGDGAEADALKSLVSKHDSNVQFDGWVNHDRLPSYYKHADLFVHPGRWPEPFGRSVLESLQYGTPAVVSDIGAPPWIVGDAGETFIPGDQKRLASIIRALKSNDEKMAIFSERATDRIKQFSPEHVISDIERNYQKVVYNAD